MATLPPDIPDPLPAWRESLASGDWQAASLLPPGLTREAAQEAVDAAGQDLEPGADPARRATAMVLLGALAERFPDWTDLDYWRSLGLAQDGDLGGFLGTFFEATEGLPPEAQEARARVLLELGGAQALLDLTDPILERFPHLHIPRAFAFASLRDFQAALGAIRLGLELEPHNPQLRALVPVIAKALGLA